MNLPNLPLADATFTRAQIEARTGCPSPAIANSNPRHAWLSRPRAATTSRLTDAKSSTASRACGLAGLGHGRKEIVQAIATQAATLDYAPALKRRSACARSLRFSNRRCIHCARRGTWPTSATSVSPPGSRSSPHPGNRRAGRLKSHCGCGSVVSMFAAAGTRCQLAPPFATTPAEIESFVNSLGQALQEQL
jgi:hypothetical protein